MLICMDVFSQLRMDYITATHSGDVIHPQLRVYMNRDERRGWAAKLQVQSLLQWVDELVLTLRVKKGRCILFVCTL